MLYVLLHYLLRFFLHAGGVNGTSRNAPKWGTEQPTEEESAQHQHVLMLHVMVGGIEGERGGGHFEHPAQHALHVVKVMSEPKGLLHGHGHVTSAM